MTNDCPRCRGRMEAGFIEERVSKLESVPTRWIEGVPKRSFWWGLKRTGKRMIDVSTDRCTACGYLESYAK
jgi:hypothetical protein